MHLQHQRALKNVRAIGQLPAQELRPGIEPGTFAFGITVRRSTTELTQQMVPVRRGSEQVLYYAAYVHGRRIAACEKSPHAAFDCGMRCEIPVVVTTGSAAQQIGCWHPMSRIQIVFIVHLQC